MNQKGKNCVNISRNKNCKIKKLVGMSKMMSFANNLTADLWYSFMSRRNEIEQCINQSLISMQKYPPSFDFNPDYLFEKWAVVEVSEYTNIPDKIVKFTLPEGSYAVFHYKGLSTNNRIFQYIFTEWLPTSQYLLDNERPHFEVLDEKYKNNDTSSEENIYISIKYKCSPKIGSISLPK